MGILKQIADFKNGINEYTNDDDFKETLNLIITDILFLFENVEFKETKKKKIIKTKNYFIEIVNDKHFTEMNLKQKQIMKLYIIL